MKRFTLAVGLVGGMALLLVLATLFALAQAPDTGPYVQQNRLGRGLVRSVAWSPDGDMIAVGGALGIWLYDAALNDLGLLTGHDKAVYGLAFSPDGAQLASASHDHTVRVWDLAAREERLRLEGHTDLVVAVAWSPDGDMIASAGWDGALRFWNPVSGTLIRTIQAHEDIVYGMAWSPDGAQIATASWDGTARTWDAASGDLVQTLTGHTGRVHRVVWDPAGQLLATLGWDDTVRVWDAATGRQRAEQPEHMDWVLWVRWDGDTVRGATQDRRLLVWDAASGELRDVQPARDRLLSEGESPDGTKLASIDDEGIVRVQDTATGDVIAVLPGRANGLAWNADGTRLAVAVRNGTITIWGSE